MRRETTTEKTSSPYSQPIMSTALNFPFGLIFWATVSWGGPMKGPNTESRWGCSQKWLIRLIWFNTSHEGSGILDEVGGGGGYNFRGGLISRGQFWKCTKWDGVELLRHRTGLLCKSCQTILWFKQIHVNYVHTQAQERLILMAL